MAPLTLLLAVLLAALGPAPARAQAPPPATAPPATAPVFLEPGHWGWDVARRLVGLGLAPASADPAAAPVTVPHLRRLLLDGLALLEAGGGGREPGLHGRLAAWLELLEAETSAPAALARLRLETGYSVLRGEALAGDGYFADGPDPDWEGAATLPGVSSPVGLVAASGYLGRQVSWDVHAGRVGGDWAVPSATLAAALGPLDLWAGRRRLHYGAGRGGGTVAGSGWSAAPELTRRSLHSLDGAGLQVRHPFRLPGALGHLGEIRLEAAGGRLPANGVVEEPFVAFGRVSLTPHPRFTLGVDRGAIFGGKGNPVTARRLVGLLAGVHGGEGGEFENQVVSLLARVRPPLGAVPLQLFLEWGMDDTAGAIRDAPAIVAGADLAAVPGVQALALGAEFTRFPRSCCGNPIWYRNVFFRGSWADRGRPFAHPLGGHGREILAHGRLDLPAAGVSVRADGFMRTRGEENLFVPGREGRSRGGTLRIDFRLPAGVGVWLDGALEQGAGWSSRRAALVVHRSLRPTLPH